MGTGSVDTADAREVVDVPDGTFVVIRARVFDGARFRPATSVLVVEGRIAAVEDRATPPAHAPAGVRLLAGTDVASPGTAHGVGLHDELALLVRAGLVPGQR